MLDMRGRSGKMRWTLWIHQIDIACVSYRILSTNYQHALLYMQGKLTPSLLHVNRGQANDRHVQECYYLYLRDPPIFVDFVDQD